MIAIIFIRVALSFRLSVMLRSSLPFSLYDADSESALYRIPKKSERIRENIRISMEGDAVYFHPDALRNPIQRNLSLGDFRFS
jgi:hypothetical protein